MTLLQVLDTSQLYIVRTGAGAAGAAGVVEEVELVALAPP